MSRRLISSGSTFERDMGYSRAVVDGEWVFVSGTTGFNYQTMTIAEGVVEQAEQCFRNIERALSEAGSGLSDVVRVRYILPRVADFEACWPVLRKYFGEVRPAATMIEAGLSDPRMKIEVEVTARKRSVETSLGVAGKSARATSSRSASSLPPSAGSAATPASARGRRPRMRET